MVIFFISHWEHLLPAVFLPLVSTILINILLIIIWNTVQNSPKMTRITHIRDPRTITDHFWTRPESWSDLRKLGPGPNMQKNGPTRTLATYPLQFRTGLDYDQQISDRFGPTGLWSLTQTLPKVKKLTSRSLSWSLISNDLLRYRIISFWINVFYVKIVIYNRSLKAQYDWSHTQWLVSVSNRECNFVFSRDFSWENNPLMELLNTHLWNTLISLISVLMG